MRREFKLPDLGEGISEVELRRWLVQEGDQVAEHQPVVEVETDKAVVEVPSPFAGRVSRLAAREGETVRVGETLLEVASGDEAAPAPPVRAKSVGIVGELPEYEEPQQPPPAEVLATPSVRKRAREMGRSLAGVTGTGPRGSITMTDLERLGSKAEGPKAEARPGARAEGRPLDIRAVPVDPALKAERIPIRGVRKAVARNVGYAKTVSAPVSTMEEADVTELWIIRDREQHEVESKGDHLTFLPFFIKAVVHALMEHPYLNASIDDLTETIILKKEYHFGIAVDTEEGLMVPVLRDVDRKSIRELARELNLLGKKARQRSIGVEEMKGSSFTLTNFGHYGGSFATPIINWPDVAILGFGRISERPWVHRGEIVARRILPLSLTFDHRVTDGAEAGRFLMKVVQYLEDPALLLIDGG